MTELPPLLGQQPVAGQAPEFRRPATVIAAVALMAPVVATWLIAGVGFLVAIARTEDGTGKFLLWILAFAILALCLLVATMGAVGMMQAWRGRRTIMNTPAGFTLGLFCIAVINLIVQGKISYSPTQIIPIVVGVMAGIAMRLISSNSAAVWLAQPR